MRRALIPIFVAALAAAASIGCQKNNAESTAGSTDTIQTGSTATGNDVASNSSGGASPAMSTTAPVPGTTTAPVDTTGSTATGNASGSGSTGTSGTLPGGTAPASATRT